MQRPSPIPHQNMIAMDADPPNSDPARWVPDLRTFERQGMLEWEPHRLGVFMLDEQREGESGIQGFRLMEAALDANARLPNIHLLEFLYRNPDSAPLWLIEGGWYLYSLKPLYVEHKGGTYARYLHWDRTVTPNRFAFGDTLMWFGEGARRDRGHGFTAKCVLATYG